MEDVTPLQGCAALRRLTIRGCLAFSDMWPLTGCKGLESLHVLHCTMLCDDPNGGSCSIEFMAALNILQRRVRSVRVLSGGRYASRLVHHSKQPPLTHQYSTPWLSKWQTPRWWGECQPHTREAPFSQWTVFQQPGTPLRRSGASAPPGVRFIGQPRSNWAYFETICVTPTRHHDGPEISKPYFFKMLQGFLGALWQMGYSDVEYVGSGKSGSDALDFAPSRVYIIHTAEGMDNRRVLEDIARNLDGMHMTSGRWQTSLTVRTCKGTWDRRKRHLLHQSGLIGNFVYQ